MTAHKTVTGIHTILVTSLLSFAAFSKNVYSLITIIGKFKGNRMSDVLNDCRVYCYRNLTICLISFTSV